MSLSQLETLHHLCQLERTQILQSLGLAVLKIPQDIYCQAIDQNSLTTKRTSSGTAHVLKMFHRYTFLRSKDVTKIPYNLFKKIDVLDTLSLRTFVWDTAISCGSGNSHIVVNLKNSNEMIITFVFHTLLLCHK